MVGSTKTEQLGQFEETIYGEVDTWDKFPLIIDVRKLEGEQLATARAESLAVYAGGLMTAQQVETTPGGSERRSLRDAIKLAKEKRDEVSLAMMEVNVTTGVMEHTIKDGHVIEVEQRVNGDEIYQNGQSATDIQLNSLIYASGSWQMAERVKAENRNSFRLKNALKAGLLKDYVFVVFSRTADNMTHNELKESGFFTNTMPFVIQCTTLNGQTLTTQSAFVAGIGQPGGEQHDQQTVVKAANELSIDYEGKTATEIIDRPRLIHKSLIPNGVIDLVKLCDMVSGGTFFGQNKPPQDYLTYLEFCRERVKGYLPKVQLIMGELIKHADALDSPRDAVELLEKLCDQQMVEYAIWQDWTINPMVFGEKAAPLIEHARWLVDNGKMELAARVTKKTQAVSDSRPCPSGLKSEKRELSDKLSSNIEINEESWDGGKKHYNTKCRCCEKVKKEVGACYICEDCVKNPSKLSKAYQQNKAETKVNTSAKSAKLFEFTATP